MIIDYDLQVLKIYSFSFILQFLYFFNLVHTLWHSALALFCCIMSWSAASHLHMNKKW